MNNYKRAIIVIVLSLMVVGPLLAKPKPVQAFSPGVVTVNGAKWGWERLQGILAGVWEGMIHKVAVDTARMFMNNLAYDLATSISESGSGKKSLYDTKPRESATHRAADAAKGEFIGGLMQSAGSNGETLASLGIDLCNPSLDLQLSLTLDILDSEEPPAPKCDFSAIKENWSNFSDSLYGRNWANYVKDSLTITPNYKRADFDDAFIALFGYEQTYLGQRDRIREEVSKTGAMAAAHKAMFLEMCKGYLDSKTTISGDVKTGCTDIMNMNEAQWDAAIAGDQFAFFENAEGGTLSAILAEAGNMFVSTLSSKLMKRAFEEGMNIINPPASELEKNPGIKPTVACALGGCVDIDELWSVGNVFSDLKATELTPVEDWTFLQDFAICPAQKDYRALDNCVIDTNLMLAVSNQETLRSAIDDGLLDGDLPIIGPNNPDNENKDCFKSGLCYRDLVKLRKANIFPVGMELAAQRVADKAVTVEEVINCFEDGGSCEYGIDPTYDNHHNPFYHLVDPDWVLRAPPTRCNAMVYGPALESSDGSSRQEYCADPQTCLREDESGNCLEGQYGYCTRSENIWRFNGDMCDDGDIYSGCLVFDNADLGTKGYIEGTLEYCTAEESGCKRYSQTRDAAGDWFMEEDMTLDPTLFTLNEDDLFLNTSECDSTYADCSEYIVMVPDLGVNLVPNGSFNNFHDDGTATNTPDGWTRTSNGTPSNGFTADYDNNKVANGYTWGASNWNTEPYAEEVLQMNVELLPNTYYIISADAAQYVAPADYGARVAVQLCDMTGDCNGATNNARPATSTGTCLLGGSGHPNNADLRFVPPSDFSWLRAGCLFMTDENTSGGRIDVMSYGGVNPNGAAPSAMWFDNIKLEIVSQEGMSATPYSEYGVGSTIYMGGERIMCSEDEVGCQAYRPVAGGPMVPAVISQDDLCPQECVGYASFAEQTTIFDNIEGDYAVNYYNFIPDTAETCPASEAGCEEFTNLDEVADGGEGKEYFSYLRQCVADDLGITYYTWEGQDVSGYQIKTWHTLESNRTIAGKGQPPCTNVQRGGILCIDDAPATNGNFPMAACGPETATILDDPENNPNCREFFDTNGDSYWRLQDRVIFASDDCHTYRRTLTGALYSAIPSLSEECGEQSGGCRAYKGNTGNNLRTILSDTFEEGTYDPWVTFWGSLDMSNESVMNEGHSMKLQLNAVNTSVDRDLSNQLQGNREYELSWWLRNNSNLTTLDVTIGSMATSTLIASFNNIQGGDWHPYTVAITEEDILNFDFTTTGLTFTFNGVDSVYFDNVTLREVTDHIYVRKDTWSTPASCDSPYSAFHLGCQAYRDRNGSLYNLKSFEKLCGEDKIGCMAVIDTHNSTNPFEETFNLEVPPEPAEITVSRDSLDYLVPDRSKYCPQQFKGCSELGLPKVDKANANAITGFSTVYKFNDPDQYENTLCVSEALDCETYGSSKGTYYFKDPGNKTCSFRENNHVRMLSGQYVPFTGWFQTHTLGDGIDPIGCSDNGDFNFDQSDFEYLDYIVDFQPDRWAAECPETANLCTTFKDPFDPPGCDPRLKDGDTVACVDGTGAVYAGVGGMTCVLIMNATGGGEWINGVSCKNYHYFDNNNIDYKSCVDVDRNSGCMLFYDTNNWGSGHAGVDSLYNASTTYNKNVYFDKPVNPDICANGDVGCNANTIIKVNKSRQCAEWLACKSSSSEFNPDTQQYDVLCDDISSCTEYDKRGSVTKCGNWDTYTSSTPLTTSVYQYRVSGNNSHLQWADKDYVGYAAPNLLPAKDLEVYNFGDNEDIDLRLMYRVHSTTTSCETSNYTADGIPLTNGQFCMAFPEDGISHMGYYQWINTGICKDEICWLSPDYTNQSYYIGLTTKGYAVPDSPFPQSISQDTGTSIAGREIRERRPGYGNASICESVIADGTCLDIDADGLCDAWEDGCEDSYNKITYGNGTYTAYYPTDKDYYTGVCVSTLSGTSAIDAAEAYEIIHEDGSSEFVTSPYIGSPCNAHMNCDGDASRLLYLGGRCEPMTKIETNLNLPGICYEQDKYSGIVSDIDSRANYCNLWYPITKINSTQGLYNNYDSAGYTDPYGNYIQMCAFTNPYIIPRDRYYCAASGDSGPGGNCTLLLRIPTGSLINADALDDPGDITLRDLLTNYYLKDVFTRYEATDVPGGLPGPIGMDVIVKNNGVNHINDSSAPGPRVDSRALFEPEDFVNAPAASYGVTMARLQRLYDATIEYYYLDEGVSGTGAYSSTNVNQFLSLPSSVTTTVACVPNYYYAHITGGAFPYNVCNPLDFNMYVFGGVLTPPGYGSTRAGDDCNANINGKGCYQRCNRLMEVDPLGDNAIVNTDVWWASKPENYNYTLPHTEFTFWHGSPSTSPAYLQDRSAYLASSDDIYAPGVTVNSWWSELHYDYILTPTVTPPFIPNSDIERATTSIGYAFGASVSPISRFGTDLQVQVMLPLEPFTNNFYDRTAIFMSPGPIGNWTNESSARCVNASCAFYRWWDTMDSFAYLFRQMYSLRMPSNSLGLYNQASYIDTHNMSTSARPQVGNTYSKPRILRVCGNGLCIDSNGIPEEGFTINNSNGGSIVSQESSLFAAAKFYYHAHPDHMPVRDIVMDWGDGGVPSSYYGKYKNNLPLCNPESDMPGILGSWQGFGGTEGACHEGYKVLYNQYLYNPLFPCDGATTTINGNVYTVPSVADASCFKPIIEIFDNWTTSTIKEYEGWIQVHKD